jgi:hypothetical protein
VASMLPSRFLCLSASQRYVSARECEDARQSLESTTSSAASDNKRISVLLQTLHDLGDHNHIMRSNNLNKRFALFPE